MSNRIASNKIVSVGVLAVLTTVSFGASVAAQTAPASQESAGASSEKVDQPKVDPTTAQAYLGYWLLAAKVGEQEMKMGMEIEGRGSLAATVVMARLGEMEGEAFRMEDDHLVFDVNAGVGQFTLSSRIEGESLVGSLVNDAGNFNIDFVGEKSDRLSYERFLAPANETRVIRGERMARIRFATRRPTRLATLARSLRSSPARSCVFSSLAPSS